MSKDLKGQISKAIAPVFSRAGKGTCPSYDSVGGGPLAIKQSSVASFFANLYMRGMIHSDSSNAVIKEMVRKEYRIGRKQRIKTRTMPRAMAVMGAGDAREWISLVNAGLLERVDLYEINDLCQKYVEHKFEYDKKKVNYKTIDVLKVKSLSPDIYHVYSSAIVNWNFYYHVVDLAVNSPGVRLLTMYSRMWNGLGGGGTSENLNRVFAKTLVKTKVSLAGSTESLTLYTIRLTKRARQILREFLEDPLPDDGKKKKKEKKNKGDPYYPYTKEDSPVEIRISPIGGLGVFAKKFIKENTVLADYTSAPIITTAVSEHQKWHQWQDRKGNIFDGSSLDYTIAGFFNATKKIKQADLTAAGLVKSHKKIKAGTEILVKYGGKFWSNRKKQLEFDQRKIDEFFQEIKTTKYSLPALPDGTEYTLCSLHTVEPDKASVSGHNVYEWQSLIVARFWESLRNRVYSVKFDDDYRPPPLATVATQEEIVKDIKQSVWDKLDEEERETLSERVQKGGDCEFLVEDIYEILEGEFAITFQFCVWNVDNELNVGPSVAHTDAFSYIVKNWLEHDRLKSLPIMGNAYYGVAHTVGGLLRYIGGNTFYFTYTDPADEYDSKNWIRAQMEKYVGRILPEGHTLHFYDVNVSPQTDMEDQMCIAYTLLILAILLFAETDTLEAIFEDPNNIQNFDHYISSSFPVSEADFGDARARQEVIPKEIADLMRFK
jgi:hypothetical protein